MASARDKLVAQLAQEERESKLLAREKLLATFPSMEELVAALAEVEPAGPVGKRMRAIYYLRTIGGGEAIEALSMALRDKRGSPLLRHELAYVLGQLRDERACGVLEEVLGDASDGVMVRHEAAEALGSIGAARSLPLLDAGAKDPLVEVSETCKIAGDYMRWKDLGAEGPSPAVCACMSPYSSHDPAPADARFDGQPAAAVGAVLLDAKEELFVRYGAMFALRNRGGEEACVQLGKALTDDASSALLRHEVAYVLGQLQLPAAIAPLCESLRRLDEHSMVRHESAEALGAIEGSTEEMERCEAVLREFLDDHDGCVQESCEVALDSQEYWTHQRWKDLKEA